LIVLIYIGFFTILKIKILVMVMAEEIQENAVYTTEETRKLLKISESTIKRLLKRGIIRANKVGGQYRILGKEILHLISPEVEKKAGRAYMKVKKHAVKTINRW
tara:strand:- start:3006 stop:3317 length:312 start_codon:yes stop_codon:yes gene_type:complete